MAAIMSLPTAGPISFLARPKPPFSANFSTSCHPSTLHLYLPEKNILYDACPYAARAIHLPLATQLPSVFPHIWTRGYMQPPPLSLSRPVILTYMYKGSPQRRRPCSVPQYLFLLPLFFLGSLVTMLNPRTFFPTFSFSVAKFPVVSSPYLLFFLLLQPDRLRVYATRDYKRPSIIFIPRSVSQATNEYAPSQSIYILHTHLLSIG